MYCFSFFLRMVKFMGASALNLYCVTRRGRFFYGVCGRVAFLFFEFDFFVNMSCLRLHILCRRCVSMPGVCFAQIDVWVFFWGVACAHFMCSHVFHLHACSFLVLLQIYMLFVVATVFVAVAKWQLVQFAVWFVFLNI